MKNNYRIEGNVAIIELKRKGKTVLTYIDREDLPKVQAYSGTWGIVANEYVGIKKWQDGRNVEYRLHRVIMDAPNGMVVDHIGHDPLDNRKSALRICSKLDNERNRQHPGKGYSFNKYVGKWCAWVRSDGKRKHLGNFETEAQAAAVARQARIDLGYYNVRQA